MFHSHWWRYNNEINIPLENNDFTYALPELYKDIFNNEDKVDNIFNSSSSMPIDLATAASHLTLLQTQELSAQTISDSLSSFSSPNAYSTPSATISYSLLFIFIVFGCICLTCCRSRLLLTLKMLLAKIKMTH